MDVDPCSIEDCYVTVAFTDDPNSAFCWNGIPRFMYEFLDLSCPEKQLRCESISNRENQHLPEWRGRNWQLALAHSENDSSNIQALPQYRYIHEWRSINLQQLHVHSINGTSGIQILMFPAANNPFEGNFIAYRIIYRQMNTFPEYISPREALERFRAAAASGKLDKLIGVKIGEHIIFDRSASPVAVELNQSTFLLIPKWAIALVAVVGFAMAVTLAWYKRERVKNLCSSTSLLVTHVESVSRTSSGRAHIYQMGTDNQTPLNAVTGGLVGATSSKDAVPSNPVVLPGQTLEDDGLRRRRSGGNTNASGEASPSGWNIHQAKIIEAPSIAQQHQQCGQQLQQLQQLQQQQQWQLPLPGSIQDVGLQPSHSRSNSTANV